MTARNYIMELQLDCPAFGNSPAHTTRTYTKCATYDEAEQVMMAAYKVYGRMAHTTIHLPVRDAKTGIDKPAF